MIDWQPLIDALEHYDHAMPERDKLWAAIDDEDSFQKASRASYVALVLVQDAFWQCTKHINARERCSLITIEDARRTVSKEVRANEAS